MDYKAQKRLITQTNSKLTKLNIVAMMQDEAAWSTLGQETRARLYSLLPQPKDGEKPYDIDQHPLKSPVGEWIEKALVQWQNDLRDGRETKKFRSHKITTTAADMPLEDLDSDDDGKDPDYDSISRKK